MLFRDRADAGVQLAGQLKKYKNSVVLAIPRGGVEVALPVAKRIKAPLEVIVARKIAMPQDPETGIGAVTPEGEAVYNELYLTHLFLTEEELQILEKEARSEAARRDKLYNIGKRAQLKEKVAILVDDGLATGYTMLATIRALKRKNPAKIIVASPVATSEAYQMIKEQCDEIVCLHVSDAMTFAVASFYEEFSQLADEEVLELLKESKE